MAGEIWALKTAAWLLAKSPETIAASERLIGAIMPEATSAAVRDIGLKAIDVARKIGIVPEELTYPLAGDTAHSAASASAHIAFKPNGLAQITGGNPTAYRKSDDLFFTYESKQHPEQISQTFQRGYLHNENASPFVDVQRDKPMFARLGGVEQNHAWESFSSKEHDAVKAFIPDGSIPIGLGSKRQAWFTPAEDVVVLGPLQERPKVSVLLPAIRRDIVGTKQFEWYPLGESDSVTRADVRAVNHQIRMEGFYTDDSFTANYVRLQSGKVFRVDPEDLYPMSDKAWREYVATHSDS